MLPKINRLMIIIHVVITFLLYVLCMRMQAECNILYSMMCNMQRNVFQKAEYDATVYEALQFQIVEAQNLAESAYDKAQYVIDTKEREIK